MLNDSTLIDIADLYCIQFAHESTISFFQSKFPNASVVHIYISINVKFLFKNESENQLLTLKPSPLSVKRLFS